MKKAPQSLNGRLNKSKASEGSMLVPITKMAPELKNIFGKPCWDAHWYNYGSLSFNVGKPRLETVHEPDETLTTAADIRNRKAHRIISVRGDWQFRLQFCRWRVLFGDKCVLRGSAKPEELVRFARSLNGQRLLSMTVELSTGKTIMRFDLNTTLEIVRDRKQREVMWYFYGRNGEMRAMYSNGEFSNRYDDVAPRTDGGTP